MDSLTTGELARTANVSLRTIRWYTEAGLLTPITIGDKCLRLRYPVTAIEQIETIQLLAEAGLKLSEIHDFLESARNLRTEKKERTLFLRKKVEELGLAILKKEERFRLARERLQNILERTQRCPTCASRGKRQNCRSCDNLNLLEAAVLGRCADEMVLKS